MEFSEKSIVSRFESMDMFIIIRKRNFLSDNSNMWTSIKTWFFFCLNEFTISISCDVWNSFIFNAESGLITIPFSMLLNHIAFNIFRHIFVMFSYGTWRAASSSFIRSFINDLSIYFTISASCSISEIPASIANFNMCA